MDTADTQRLRRRLFSLVLAAIFLPVLAISLLPTAQAEEAVVEVGQPPTTPSSAVTTSEAAPATEMAPTTATEVPATGAVKPKAKPEATTTTTTRPRPTTTTSTPPRPTTTAAPMVAAASAPAPEAATLACIRKRESGGNYTIVSADGVYFGAYQFARSSWDSTARHAGRADLVGVAPNVASPGDQDAMALDLLRWQGTAPWGGAC